MNTIVWVMLVYGYGATWIPTLEFTTEQKCIAAAVVVKTKIDVDGGTFISSPMPKCVRIEK